MKKQKLIILLTSLVILCIPSFILAERGEWIVNGQLIQEISAGASITKFSDSLCSILGQEDLIWVGGGHEPSGQDVTAFWAIYNMITCECIWSGYMLNPRRCFPAVEFDEKLLIIGGGTTACEIFNPLALIDSTYILCTPTDPISYEAIYHSAILIKDGPLAGNVLNGGGYGGDNSPTTWQIYDTDTETWGSVFYSNIGRINFELENIPNSNGNILAVAGHCGYPQVEIFKSDLVEWVIAGELPYGMTSCAMSPISNTKFLVTGGVNGLVYYNTGIIYNILTQQCTVTDTFETGRCSHGSVILPINGCTPFIGGGYTENGATKTCYSYSLETNNWMDETDLPGYQSWVNFFLTSDYHVFAIGNANSGFLTLYTWNHTPFLVDYQFIENLEDNSSFVSVNVADPDLDSVSVRFYFTEADSTVIIEWTEYQPSNSVFEISYTWNTTEPHTVHLEIRDIYEPIGVHNSLSDLIELIPNATVDPQPEHPVLLQNYPNPFKNKTRISFLLKHPQNVKLEIYNIKGQLIETLVDGKLIAGSHNVIWNPEDVPNGIYFYKLKLIIIRVC